jgi:excisionase family DNA binding protein
MSGLPDPTDRPLLTVDEARQAIGCIGRSAFYEAIKRGEIPGVRRAGRRVYISTVALREWCGLERQPNGNGNDDGEVVSLRE